MEPTFQRAVHLTCSDIPAEHAVLLWSEAGCDNYPWPLCALVLEASKQIGPLTAVRLLQRCLAVPVDGIPGLKTAAAINKYDLPSLCDAYLTERIIWMMGNRKFDVNGRIWLRNLFVTARNIYAA